MQASKSTSGAGGGAPVALQPTKDTIIRGASRLASSPGPILSLFLVPDRRRVALRFKFLPVPVADPGLSVRGGVLSRYKWGWVREGALPPTAPARGYGEAL